MSDATQQPNSGVYSRGSAEVVLPRHCSVIDINGKKIGYVRNTVYYNLRNEEQGRFFKNDETGAVEYRQKDAASRGFIGGSAINYPLLVGHLDSEYNIISVANTYIASLKISRWQKPLLIIFLLLCLLATIISMLFVNTTKDYVPSLFVTEVGGSEWVQDEPITVFKNGYYKESKICPGMEGTYSFRLENRNPDALNYALTFSDENKYEINLGYRLLRNGEYVRGTAETYVHTKDLNLSDLLVEAKKNDTFTLEWKWLDADPIDTVAGMENATYILNISFNAHIQGRSQNN